MDEAIINFFRLKYSLLLGQPTAEEIKLTIGSAIPVHDKSIIVRGRDLETGLPKSKKLTSDEVREALSPIIQEIVGSIKDTLEEAPPELISDIMKNGIYLAGGGSLIPGIDKMISEITKTKVQIADDPLTCVVRGCGKVLLNPSLLGRIQSTKGIN